MFDFLKLDKFRIFDDSTLGELFFPEGLNYSKNLSCCISPKHGRSFTIKINNFSWVLVKGGGWNYGNVLLYRSSKDDELYFGLFGKSDAKRELEVSHLLSKISNNFPKVLYYKSFSDYELPNKYDFLKDVKYTNGKKIEPCLLYTKVKSPFRIADLQFYTDSVKNEIIKEYSKYWKICSEDFLKTFCFKLGKNIALMHLNGFINDSLEYSNITMLAEIVDFEWITAPGILLPDGSKGDIITYERKEKEILYAVESVLFLSSIIHCKYEFYNIYQDFISAYQKVNPLYIEQNTNIQKILNKERFIL